MFSSSRTTNLPSLWVRMSFRGFQDQHAALVSAWGLNGKAITESLRGLHHFSIVDTLTDPSSRVFQVAEQMLGSDPPARI